MANAELLYWWLAYHLAYLDPVPEITSVIEQAVRGHGGLGLEPNSEIVRDLLGGGEDVGLFLPRPKLDSSEYNDSDNKGGLKIIDNAGEMMLGYGPPPIALTAGA